MTQTDKVTHIAISSQVLSFYLTGLKSEGYFKQAFLKFVNNFILQLKEVEWKYYDQFFKKGEDSTVVVYETYDNFIKTVSTVPIWEMANVTQILEAYQKDPKSIEGIVNKILR